MMTRPDSLLNTLFRALLLPGIVASALGVALVVNLAKNEYDELQDMSAVTRAHLLLEVLQAQSKLGDLSDMPPDFNPLSFELGLLSSDERTSFWVLDGQGQIILRSDQADDALLAASLSGKIVTASKHRITHVSSKDASLSVVTAIPLVERNEAILDVMIGVISGFILLGLFVAFAAYRALRRSAAVIIDLSADIERKGAHDLSPIDRKNTFAEISPAIDTIDTLMSRLDTALKAEQAFATNAAHELRTPVAICVAHVQRLQAKLRDPDAAESAAEIEHGLKRLTRLIERLLQMSRAQSGLGVSEEASDITPVVTLLLRELKERAGATEALVIHPPEGIWMSNVDPDALGIILNNLFDNALKHATVHTPITVDASQTGHIVVSNDCQPLSASALDTIKQRFARNSPLSEGFGIGLSIVQELCTQSGSQLHLASPREGEERGFSATLALPISEPR